MKHLGLLKYDDLAQLYCSILVQNCVYKLTPQAVRSGINLTINNVHNLRNQKERHLNVDIPTFKTKVGNNSFFCKDPQIWNALPDKLKTINRKDSFKREYKNTTLESYLKELNCNNPICRDKKKHTCKNTANVGSVS